MNRIPRDTHPAADRVQIALLQQASSAERFALARSLSKTTIELAWRALRRSRPELDEQEADLLFVEYHYGKDLGDRLRRYLKQKTA